MTKCDVVQCIYIEFDKRFSNLKRLSLTLDLNFWHCFDIHSLLHSCDWWKKACRTDEAAVCRNCVTIKKTKDLYNDQTYESIKNIMSYSIWQQVINKNAIIFYQNNMSKHPPSPMNWSSFMSIHSRLPTSIMNYLVV